MARQSVCSTHAWALVREAREQVIRKRKQVAASKKPHAYAWAEAQSGQNNARMSAGRDDGYAQNEHADGGVGSGNAHRQVGCDAEEVCHEVKAGEGDRWRRRRPIKRGDEVPGDQALDGLLTDLGL